MANLSVEDVCGIVIDRLASGTYSHGSKLPTTRELAKEIGVHRNTVAKAYRSLADLGLVRVEQGRGTYATALPIEEKSRRPLLEQIAERIMELAMRARRLGVSLEQFRSLVNENIDLVYHEYTPHTAFVECNLSDAEAAVAEIETLTGFSLTPVLLKEIESAPSEIYEEYDLVFTSLFHLKEVIDLLSAVEEPKLKVIGVYTQPDERALSEIAQIKPGSCVGVIVNNSEGGRHFANLINAYTTVTTELLVRPTTDGEVCQFAEEVDAVVYSRSQAARVETLDLDVPAIALPFHVSQQSVGLIIDALLDSPEMAIR